VGYLVRLTGEQNDNFGMTTAYVVTFTVQECSFMKSRNHEEATAELFQQDASFAADYLRRCLIEGTPEDVRVGLRQMTGLLTRVRSDEFEKIHTSRITGLFDRTLVRYELACDAIGALVAHYSEIIATERGRVPADGAILRVARVMQAVLRAEREELDPTDSARIEKTIARYAPLARRLYQGKEFCAEPKVNAALGFATISREPDGSVMNDEERAVRALLMRGDITHDEAVQCYLILRRYP
jgi:hypothetical protein